jgi:pectinesterase
MYSINVRNNYGAGAQAVALVANGNQQGFYASGFYGYQDTLYAKSGSQYYSNCYMEGAVDYVFGDAGAWFGECTFASNGGGAITATSRELATDTTWYVIDHSTVSTNPSLRILNGPTDTSQVTEVSGASLTGKVYLGRPWRNLSRVIFQNSVLTGVVAPTGWTTLSAGATP